DETRSILDGHIILSRKLAAGYHYPAIDILTSKSRVMDAVVTSEHKEAAGTINSLLATYADVELLVKIGEYQKGSDPKADLAIAKHDVINDFLKQRTDEFQTFDEIVASLQEVAR
ncbi:MAG: EscN/YscN/HrcN family type III secretion system ATPase, partial [Pseudomonadota bacterium]